jgi:hypothetical protein
MAGCIAWPEEGSGRFLKKAAQKRLLCRGMGCVGDNAHATVYKVFLLLFVHKKKPSLPCEALPMHRLVVV